VLELTRLRDFRFAGDDRPVRSGFPLHDSWVCPAAVNRDTTDPQALANWEAAIGLLHEAEIEYRTIRVSHFGHGWYELLLIKPCPTAEEFLEEMVQILETEGILDYELYEEKMQDEIKRDWSNHVLRQVRRHLLCCMDPRYPEDGDWSAEDYFNEVFLYNKPGQPDDFDIYKEALGLLEAEPRNEAEGVCFYDPEGRLIDNEKIGETINQLIIEHHQENQK
jgi:hypothetical protein